MSLSAPPILDEAGNAVATLESFISKGQGTLNHAMSGDWGSVLLDVLEFFGIDIRGWIKEKLFGNFDDMSKGAGSYGEAGGQLQVLSAYVREQIQVMKSDWTGQAANAAQGQMLVYSAGLDVSGEVFKAGGKGLQKVIGLLSKLADKAMQLIEKFLNFLVDKIISALSGWFGTAKLVIKARGYVKEAIHFYDDAKDTIQGAIDAVKKGKDFYDEVKGKIEKVQKLVDDVEKAKTQLESWQASYEHAKSYVQAAAA